MSENKDDDLLEKEVARALEDPEGFLADRHALVKDFDGRIRELRNLIRQKTLDGSRDNIRLMAEMKRIERNLDQMCHTLVSLQNCAVASSIPRE